MRSKLIVFFSASPDQDLRFHKHGEGFSLEQLIPQLALEQFIATLLPTTARLNEQDLKV